jgi:hypothetical protein
MISEEAASFGGLSFLESSATDGAIKICRVDVGCDLRIRILQALNERQQVGFEGLFGGLGQIDEAEGLQPTLRGPHGEHHFRFLADGGLAEVKDDFHSQLFVERLFQVHEAAAGGKLMHFASYLAPVGQTDERQNGATQLDSKRAVLADLKGYGR